jgi:hypothetical protein
MEAIIVSPTPGPKAFKPQSSIENQSGSESTFAPTLDQAIKDQNSSQKASSVDTQRQHQTNANTNKESQTESKDTESIEEASTLVQNTVGRFIPSQDHSGTSTAKQTAFAEFTNSRIAVTQPNNTAAQQESKFSINDTTKSINEPTISAQFSQPLNGPSGTTKENNTADQPQKAGNSIYLQNNDTISWNQPKTAAPNILSQNSSFLQFSLEETHSNNSSAIRVESFTSIPNELTAKGTTENTEKSLPLSVERLAAKLTDVPVQASNLSTSLRENAASLRQDPHEQFIEAKLEHIDKKTTWATRSAII